VPKYRRKILTGEVAERLKEIVREICVEYDWEIEALEVMVDLSITHIFSIMLKDVRLPSHQIKARGDTHCLRNSLATILPGRRKNSPP